MKTKQIPDGVWPVMLTPFRGRNVVDWSALKQLVDWYVGQGVHGLFSACLSSEALEMTDECKLDLVKHVIEFADGRVPVVAGVMGVVERSKRVEMVQSVLEYGAAAAVLTLCDIAPQDATDEQWIDEMEWHREQLSGLSLGVYECPWPYHRMLTPALTDYVTRFAEFGFLKETSCDLAEMKRKHDAGLTSGLKVFSADARSIREAYALGLNGYSGLQTNLWPGLHVKLFECYKTDPVLAEKLQTFFVEYNWVLQRAYPASAKLLLKKAHHMELNTLSFLNGASVGEEDREWIDDVVDNVRSFSQRVGC